MTTLLTTTGARPAAWRVCEQLMLAQDYEGEVRWVIVDDGDPPQPIRFARAGWTLEVVTPRPSWRPGQNTQARNLLAGLALISATDQVVIVEDDDWYADDWLTHVLRELAGHDVVGETQARYYNVRVQRGTQLANVGHASLCATAVQSAGLEALVRIATRGPRYIDLELWRQPLRRRLFHGHRVVGIKGLPGRQGIGMGHRADFRGQADPDGRLLAAWVGAAAAAAYVAVMR